MSNWPWKPCIIKNLKHYYRKKLVVDYINSLDQTKAFVNLKKAILTLHEAWEDVKKETIKNCFKKVAIIPGLHGSYVEENLSSDPVLETQEWAWPNNGWRGYDSNRRSQWYLLRSFNGKALYWSIPVMT